MVTRSTSPSARSCGETRSSRLCRNELLEQLSFDVTPQRGRLDGWRSVGGLVRRLADLARYAHPRYAQAPVLRERMTKRTLEHLTRSYEFEPIGRRLALRLARRVVAATDAELSERVIRRMARLEGAIPASPAINRFIRKHSPDVVLVTPVVKYASDEVEYLKSARRLRIPAASCVASWDNLTNKGLLKFAPERVFVWNELQRRRRVTWHGIPPERVVATGAQRFDKWFEQRPSRSREQFMGTIGLDPGQPYVVYVCSSPFVTEGGEVDFVMRWIESLASSGDERLRRLGVVIRPHPGVPRRWADVDLSGMEQAVVWPRQGALPVSEEAKTDFFDTIAHSAAVVGINTTAMIEAAIIGKSVLTILAPEFAQESTLHFHYLLAANGGFLHVASSLEEHAAQLAHVLDEDAAGAEQRRRFVESFVRPGGLDRPATPILADAVEELASIPVQGSVRAGPWWLRALLSVEAGLSFLAITVAPARRRLRKTRRRLLRRAARRQTVHP